MARWPGAVRGLVLVLVLVLIGLGAWRWHVAHQDGQPEALGSGASKKGGGSGGRRSGSGGPSPVRVAVAQRRDLDVKLDALGTATATQTATVRARVDGLLQSVHFREGQLVKAGDLLADMDSRPFKVQLTQAEGLLARDQAQLANARVDLARYQLLVDQDAGPKQQLDSQAALVRQYEGAIKTDQGNVDSARLQLSFTQVTAPVSGRIGLRLVDAGNMVHTADASGLAVITQVQPISVLFSIPQAQLPEVLKRWRAGDKLSVEAFDRDGKTSVAHGVLQTIDNQLDVATGSVKLKAQFRNDDLALFPNQFVNVRLMVSQQQGAVAVPDVAVQRGTPGTFVYVVDADRKVSIRRIKLGSSDSGFVAVLDGLEVGEQVVVDGTDRLREGAKIDVIRP